MNIHVDVTVTLPYWKWMYFLGWLDAQKIQEIASGVKP